MTDWFRSWHGAPTDPKWRLVARLAGVRAGEVWAVISYLWDRASQAIDRGSIAGADPDLIAEVFGYEAGQVKAIMAALAEKNVIAGDRIVAWDKYQPKREDNSSARVREHRAKKAAHDPQPIETVVKHVVTQRNAPDTDTDTEKITPLSPPTGGRRRSVNPFLKLAKELGSVEDRPVIEALGDRPDDRRISGYLESPERRHGAGLSGGGERRFAGSG